VLDHKKAVEQLEGHRRNGKEVECYDRLGVILEEGQPTFLWITATPHHSEIPSYTSFGNDGPGFWSSP
jgi:hypothetical protein